MTLEEIKTNKVKQMKTYKNKLIQTFKDFLREEQLLNLDFRSHVYLENQYGLTPIYSYIDAEKIIDGLFSFFDKYLVNCSGRYNYQNLIESLRTYTVKEFLTGHLMNEIEENVFNAINVTEYNDYKIINAFIEDCGNTCLCIDIDEKTKQFICDRLNISEITGGEGCEGFINIQYPITNDSQTYIAGSNWVDDIKYFFDDELIESLINEIIAEANDKVSLREFELKKLFGTSNITKWNNMIEHGYYGGLSLALLENNENKLAYVTFGCGTNDSPQYFPIAFKEFENVDAARDYIQSHIDNHQSLTDFRISHDIFNDIFNELESIAL